MDVAEISIGLAFLAGLASFFSPCVFALVPAYVGYLGGRSAASARDGKSHPWVTSSHGVAFVLGFSLVFISLGVATSFLGGLLYEARTWLARIGGVVVIIFGLHMVGLMRIRFLEYDLRPQSTPQKQRGYVASFLMGIFFSAGWSPCVGPILGAILMLALNEGAISKGIILLAVYSAGLAIPFLVASVQIGLVTTVLKKFGKLMHYVEIGMGILLIAVGVLLLMGRFEQISQLGATFYGSYDEVLLGQALLILLIGLLFLGLIPAIIAQKKGRSFFTWWFFGVSLLPVALPLALLLKPLVEQPEAQA
jgi:cytochrome c-type biogenesis protein